MTSAWASWRASDADAFLFRTLFDGIPRVHGHAVGHPLVGNLDIEIRPTQGRYGLEHRLDVAREGDARRIELGDPYADLVGSSAVGVVDVTGDPGRAMSVRLGCEVDSEELIGERSLQIGRAHV